MELDQDTWERALDREAQLRSELLRLEEMASEKHGEQFRAWWRAVEEVLRQHGLALASGKQISPPPCEVVLVLRGLAGYLAVGQMPGPVDSAIKSGRREPGPTEAHDIGCAVAYLQAANGGFVHNGERVTIDDTHPTKTVAAAFDVNRRTVQKWRAKRKPALMGLGAVNADGLRKQMERAGKWYRIAGRSSGAINRRDAKRGERN